MKKLKIIVKSDIVDGYCTCRTRITGKASGDEIAAQEVAAIGALANDMDESIRGNQTSLTFLKDCTNTLESIIEKLTTLKNEVSTIAEQREYILGETE